MAQLTRANVSLVQKGNVVGTFTAGSALTAGDAVYIDGNGKVLGCGSALVDEANHPYFCGFVVADVAVNGPTTIFGVGSIIHLASSTTAGTRYWITSASVAAGGLTDSKVASSDSPVAKAINSSGDFIVVRPAY